MGLFNRFFSRSPKPASESKHGELAGTNDLAAEIELPKAFSVRDEHEFQPFQHLMWRLNPKLTVQEIATGVHVNGGGTVYWGLVYLVDERPSKKEIETALREAGFDFALNLLTQAAFVWSEDAPIDEMA